MLYRPQKHAKGFEGALKTFRTQFPNPLNNANEQLPSMAKVSSGSGALDKLLEGGYETDVITTIYGPAGSGKTTTCLLAAVSTATVKENKDKKVVFIDTEGGFST